MLSNNANAPNIVVFGEVVGVHIDDSVIVDGRINFLKLGVIGRLGYLDFVAVNNVFSMNRPDWDPK